MSIDITGTLRETRDEVLSVEWQIDDFQSLAGTVGTKYTSPAFRFSDSSWNVTIFPYGDEDEGSDSLIFYLSKKENLTEIVTWRFGLKKADGTVRFGKKTSWKFVDYSEGLAPATIFPRSRLLQEKDVLLPSGVLTAIWLLKKAPHQELNELSIDLKDMLISKKHSDVTIRVKQKEYEAHKAILAARSPLFDAVFDDEMLEENSKTVHMEDCDPESFKDFLHFLYTGRADITSSNVFHLYKTADKHDVEGLMSHCVAFMINELSVDNICDVATFAEQHSEAELSCLCEQFFERNAHKILFTSKWASFLAENHLLANKLLQHMIRKIRIEE